jgi:argonaute-like protein implicated in RNA metabolism and viral defense
MMGSERQMVKEYGRREGKRQKWEWIMERNNKIIFTILLDGSCGIYYNAHTKIMQCIAHQAKTCVWW